MGNKQSLPLNEVQIILACDDSGKFLEYIPKEAGHTGDGRRHLAITVLLYNKNDQVLLQRRKHKVFDNIWDFTASTHPLHLKSGKDETREQATLRALKEEYGIENVELVEVGSFNYFAKIGDLCENEHDYLLIGEYNGEFILNPTDAYEAKWVSKKEMLVDMEKNPNKFTAWALESLKLLKESGFFKK